MVDPLFEGFVDPLIREEQGVNRLLRLRPIRSAR